MRMTSTQCLTNVWNKLYECCFSLELSFLKSKISFRNISGNPSSSHSKIYFTTFEIIWRVSVHKPEFWQLIVVTARLSEHPPDLEAIALTPTSNGYIFNKEGLGSQNYSAVLNQNGLRLKECMRCHGSYGYIQSFI